MRKIVSIKLLLMPIMLFVAEADSGVIDKMDSLAVWSILGQIGWTGVPVDSVIEKNQIVTSAAARVTGLNLSYRAGLPKISVLSPTIQKLPELTSLTLTGNALSDLPTELTQLLKLRQLNISSNAFTRLPELLGKIPSLQALDASNNRIDSLTPFIENCSNLVIVNLQANRISSIPPQIQSLTGMKNLSLISNRIEQLPEEIASLTGLELLRLDSNELSTLPPRITSLQHVKIGVVSNRICTLTDYSLIAWLNTHHLTPEWRATQRCDDTGYAAIATDLVTGTVVSFTSTYESLSGSGIPNAVSVEAISTSSPSFPIAAPSGKTLLKAVNIAVNPIFKTSVNTFTISMSFKEPEFSNIDISRLSIYFFDGVKWIYLGGTVSAEKRTITVKSGKEGMYALINGNEKTTSVQQAPPSRKLSFVLVKSPSGLLLTFNRRPSSGISVSFLTLAGKLVSRVAIERLEGNQTIAVKIPATLSGKPGIVAMNDGKETVTRLIVLP